MTRHRAAERASRAVYFTIVALAIIVALEEAGADVSSEQVLLSTIGATILTALAELYARYIAEAIRTKSLDTREEMRAIAADTAVGTLAALVPVTPFVLAAAGVISERTAYDVASWLGLAVLGTYTMIANRAAGLTGVRALATAGAVVLLGFGLIALKSLVH